MLVSMTGAMWHSAVVLVPMMFIVQVFMRMFQHVVSVRVVVALGQVQPNTCTHQHTGKHKRKRYRFAEQDKSDYRPSERCNREVRARSRSAEVTQRNDEQYQARAETEKPDRARSDNNLK